MPRHAMPRHVMYMMIIYLLPAMMISLMYFIVNRGKGLSGSSRDEHTLPSY